MGACEADFAAPDALGIQGCLALARAIEMFHQCGKGKALDGHAIPIKGQTRIRTGISRGHERTGAGEKKTGIVEIKDTFALADAALRMREGRQAWNGNRTTARLDVVASGNALDHETLAGALNFSETEIGLAHIKPAEFKPRGEPGCEAGMGFFR